MSAGSSDEQHLVIKSYNVLKNIKRTSTGICPFYPPLNVSASHNLVSLSVPSVAPKITSLTTNSTAIRVTWEPIPEEHVNGVLRGYYVIYWRMPRVSQDNHVIQVNQTTLSVVIVGLKRNTSYGVQLTGLTRVRGYIRNGVLSRTQKVTTKYGKERFVISKH